MAERLAMTRRYLRQEAKPKAETARAGSVHEHSTCGVPRGGARFEEFVRIHDCGDERPATGNKASMMRHSAIVPELH
jgi:hypothetical protein